jgi:hypothetical protein
MMNGNRSTLGKTARVLTKYVACVALMASVLTVVLESTASASGTITHATGFPVTVESSVAPGVTSLAVTPQHIGDLLILESQIHSATITVTGVTGTGTGTWALAEQYVNPPNSLYPNGITEEIWWAVATATAATTINVAYSASVAALTPELVADSFTPSTLSSSVWSVVASNGATAASTSTITFPSLTSGTSANQLYWGYAESTGTAGLGSTTGFTYALTTDGSGNLTTYDAGVAPSANNTPTAPTAAGDNSSTAVIFADTAPPTPATDTIAFNSQSGSVASSISGPDTSTITLPTTTWPGHTFSGWFTASSGGSLQSSPYTLAGSTTLFAQWTTNATDTIAFNSQGGSAVTSMSGPNGATITLPADSTLAGNTSTGWFAASSGGSALTSPYTLTGSTTLFAQWTTTDTIAFNSQGGSAVTSMSGPNGATITLPADSTLTGNTSTGWFAASSGGSALSSTYILTGSTTLFAQWTTTDTIAFNSEGGSAVTSMIGADGSTITLPAAPTLAGNTFNGWFAASSGGSALSSTYILAGSTTLYAQWTVTPPVGVGSPAPTLGSLAISASSLNVTVGGTISPTAAVSGLSTGDTATVASVTFTYAGTGSTVYAASTTAPSAVGSYSVTPSAGTVTISPSTDASKYSATYTYVAGSLVISAVVVPPPPPPTLAPHASRVVGSIVVGESRTVTIIGTGFATGSHVRSNESGAVVRVRSVSATRIVLKVSVRKGQRPARHTFTITAAKVSTCRIGYLTK